MLLIIKFLLNTQTSVLWKPNYLFVINKYLFVYNNLKMCINYDLICIIIINYIILFYNVVVKFILYWILWKIWVVILNNFNLLNFIISHEMFFIIHITYSTYKYQFIIICRYQKKWSQDYNGHFRIWLWLVHGLN